MWRKTNEAMKMKNLHPTFKHGSGGIMVWEFMAVAGVGNLQS